MTNASTLLQIGPEQYHKAVLLLERKAEKAKALIETHKGVNPFYHKKAFDEYTALELALAYMRLQAPENSVDALPEQVLEGMKNVAERS